MDHSYFARTSGHPAAVVTATVAVEGDFDGAGAFSVREDGVDGTRTTLQGAQKVSFDAPGVYSPCARVTPIATAT